MKTSRKFVQTVRRAARARLQELGWVYRRQVYILAHHKSIWGKIGLADVLGRDDGVYEVSPVVGVTHLRVEALVSRLKGEKLFPLGRGTVTEPLCYLMPAKRWNPWEFVPSANWQAILDDMMAKLREYGFPFVDANLDLKAACATLQRGEYGNPSETVFSLPAALLLLGRLEEMEAALEDWLRENPESPYYRKYADDLRRLAASGKVEEFVKEAMPAGVDL